MSMDREELTKDRDQLTNMLRLKRQRLQQTQVEIFRLEGALAYIEDNLKEAPDDKQEPD